MSRAGSGPEFHINSSSGRAGSLHLWVGLGWVKKIGPTSNFDCNYNLEREFWSWLWYLYMNANTIHGLNKNEAANSQTRRYFCLYYCGLQNVVLLFPDIAVAARLVMMH